MISLFCDKIADVFLKNDVIEEKDKEIYKYGLEILTSTIIGVLIIFIIGIVTHQIFEAVTFYLIYATLRVYTGGYHASTYFKCKIYFSVNFIIVLYLSAILQSLVVTPIFALPFHIIGFVVISKYAPIQNKNKLINDVDKVKYKKISILLYCIWNLICMIFIIINRRIFWIISLSINSIIMLMLFDKFIKEGE